MLEVELEEGVIITLENNEEYLLLKRTKDGFFAVGIEEDNPTDKYFAFKLCEEDGEIYMKLVSEFSVL